MSVALFLLQMPIEIFLACADVDGVCPSDAGASVKCFADNGLSQNPSVALREVLFLLADVERICRKFFCAGHDFQFVFSALTSYNSQITSLLTPACAG